MAYVSKPIEAMTSGWIICVRANKSPLSPIIERLSFTSREAAWLAYFKIMRGV